MSEPLNHAERLQALREGIVPDRPPVSIWRHFYNEENDPDEFIEATINWQKKFDWDFIKINPKASFHYEPWGVKMTYSPDCVIKPKRTVPAIRSISDWEKVSELPMSHPEFAGQLRAIAGIRKAFPKPFRIVMTVFNPVSIAGDMVASDAVLLAHLRESPETVERALSAIQKTFIAFAQESRNAGADGLFFATTSWACADTLTVPEVCRFGIALDRPIYDAAGDDAFNILHVCGSNNYLFEYKDFDAAITHWDSSDPTNPTLGDGYETLRRPVMGGLGHETDLLNDTPGLLREKTRRLIDSHRRLPFAVGAGCTINASSPDANVAAVREAVEASVK